MISVKNISKTFGKLQVLNDVSLDVAQGEKVVIVGPSGSGKSTFLRCMNLLEVPEKGEVWLDGQMLTSVDASLHEGLVTKKDKKAFEKEHCLDINLGRAKMGMVFQHFNLFNNLTVMGNMTLVPVELKLKTKEEATKDAEALLTRIGLLDKKDVYPSTLSGGQKQRIAIAGVLAMKPECIVLDEPTAMLDPKGRKEVMSVIRRMNREHGITIVLITHYMDEAAMADRIVVLNDGEMIVDGTPSEVFEKEALLIECGLAIPQCTEFVHRLRERGISLDGECVSFEDCVELVARSLKSKK